MFEPRFHDEHFVCMSFREFGVQPCLLHDINKFKRGTCFLRCLWISLAKIGGLDWWFGVGGKALFFDSKNIF